MKTCILLIILILLIICCVVIRICDHNREHFVEDNNITNSYFNAGAQINPNFEGKNNKLSTDYLNHYMELTGLVSAQPRNNIYKPYFESKFNQKQDDEQDFSLNFCSPNCCASQFKPPFDLPEDKYAYTYDNNKFEISNMACNNSFQDSGCLCMTKSQGDMIRSRGHNA